MKVAVFHNYMDNIGGAEKVGLILARELKADIYTTNIDQEKIEKMGFSGVNLISIGKVPINAPLRQQLALYKFRKLNLKNKYDFYIIDGDWAMAGAVNNKPNLWYVHSPIREIWDLYRYTRENIVAPQNRFIFDAWVLYNRYLNKKYVKKVDKIVCNSSNTKNRVKKYLGRETEVIYPPIETSALKYKPPKGYWLSVNRLTNHKRVDIQTKAFAKLPEEKLIIVGCYEKASHFSQYLNYIKEIKPDNVQLLPAINQEQLIDLYSKCKGFITTSKDEDFGMNVVEAMASGKPVIAPNEGGYKETIVNGKTGILIDDINEEKLAEEIKKLSKEIKKNPLKYKNVCQEQAKKFDTKIFIEKIKKEIQNSLEKR